MGALKPEVCIHCAGPASVGLSMEDPASDFSASVPVTFNVLDTLRRCSPQSKFLYTSSAAVYGNPPSLPVKEDQVLQPISPYGFHKFLCEQLAAEFRRVYGLRTAVGRIFSAYGTGLKRQVLWDICEKASKSGVLTLRGTGEESRDFINVRDVARALLLLSEKAPCEGEAYNLASGKETTIRALQEILVEGLASGVAVRFDGSSTPGDPLNWRADISRISSMGFETEIDLREGASLYARWYLKEVLGRG